METIKFRILMRAAVGGALLLAFCVSLAVADVRAVQPSGAAEVIIAQSVAEVHDGTKQEELRAPRAAELIGEGMDIQASDLRVYLVDGMEDDVILAHPRLEVIAATVQIHDDGSVTLGTEVIIAPQFDRAMGPKAPPLIVSNGRAPASLTAPYWAWFEQPYCYGRYDTSWGYHAPCFETFKLYDDTFSNADYYQFHHRQTAGATNGGMLKTHYVESDQSWTSAPMSWVAWSPDQDTSGNCYNYTFGVTAPQGGLSFNFFRCETWNMTPYPASNDAGHYRMEWGTWTNGDRAVAYVTSVSVAQGAYPVWYAWSGHRSCNSIFSQVCQDYNQT